MKVLWSGMLPARTTDSLTFTVRSGGEYWNDGMKQFQYSIIPVFHYSITPSASPLYRLESRPFFWLIE